jgi:hypothetical protein
MSKWLRAIGITCLVTAAWMISGDWVRYFRHEAVLHEHTVHSFETGPTHESARITSLWGGRAVRSVATRFHLVA